MELLWRRCISVKQVKQVELNCIITSRAESSFCPSPEWSLARLPFPQRLEASLEVCARSALEIYAYKYMNPELI